jgi:hypothetical protein
MCVQTKAKPRVAKEAIASSDGDAESEEKQRWIFTGRWETLPALPREPQIARLAIGFNAWAIRAAKAFLDGEMCLDLYRLVSTRLRVVRFLAARILLLATILTSYIHNYF